MVFRKSFISFSIALLCAFLSSEHAAAQSVKDSGASIGTWHSVKGFGLTGDIFSSRDHFDSFALTIDLNGILSGRSSTPGLKFTYNYNLPLKTGQTKNGDPVVLYAGPGIAFGYVRDTNSRIGLMGGISADIGCNIFLASKVSLGFEFSSEISFHLREDSRVGVNDFKFYEAGVTRLFLPQLKLQYYW